MGSLVLRQGVGRPALAVALVWLLSFASSPWTGWEPANAFVYLRHFTMVAGVGAIVLLLVLLFRGYTAPAALRTAATRLPAVALGVVLLVASLSAYLGWRRRIPHLVPFYADATLARIDGWVGGDVLAALATAVLSSPYGESVHIGLGVFYYQVWGIFLSASAGTLLWSAHPARTRLFLTYVATLALVGSAMAVFGSSAGPVFAPVFGLPMTPPTAALLAALHDSATAGNNIFVLRDRLLADTTAGGGTGITAFPSMHVGFSTLTLLTAYHLGWPRWARFLAALHLPLILVTSVAIGMHYLTDGLVSLGVVLLLWWGMGRITTED